MRQVKKLIRKILFQFKWILINAIIKVYSKPKKEGVLLLPAAKLNGGFGEDIMVGAFVEQFKNKSKVSIFTDVIIERPDYLSRYNCIKYISGFSPGSYFTFWKVLANHSEIYVLGADILDGTYGEHVAMERFRILKLANKLGLKCNFLGFSLSQDIHPFVKRELNDISDFTVIKLRDDESYKRVNFIPQQSLKLTSDIAFICPTEEVNDESYEIWTSKQRKIVVVCPNAIQARKSGLDKYTDNLTNLLKQFAKVENLSFVFLYHDLRPLCGKTSDKDISATLYNRLKYDYPCFYPNSIRNGLELKWYLKPCEFTLTGRMHLGISGMTLGKPMFGICYANKFEGLLNLFDINPELCLVDYEDLKISENDIQNFLTAIPALNQKVKKNLPKLKKMAIQNIISYE